MNVYQSFTVTGLVSVPFTAPEAANYAIDIKVSAPTITAGASVESQLIMTIVKNATTWYTSVAGSEGLHTSVLCAAGDIIHINFSSSNPEDQSLNVIKSTITISEGV
jgi:hypothetical protein